MTTAVKENMFRISVSDVSGQKRADVDQVPKDISVGELVEGLLRGLNLPKNDSNGRPLSYHARLDREGRHLNSSERAEEALQNDDHLVLQPNVDAG